MLLWAVTLPGHEVLVYSYVLNSLSGHASGSAGKQQQDLFKKNGLEKQAVQAYPEADTLPWRLLLQPVKCLPGTGYFVFFTEPELRQFTRLSGWLKGITRVLPLTNLPNAP